ncbi:MULTISPECIES: BON domain-containing protein [unclassified Streptomyces]|uniref:BON domain-containing protein n=1 Tax=Streptomyces sp. R33 TaxID=3238629 RepID=A0AB39XX36_9ACTN|nr:MULTISPECIES: BON domain-containing protein [unclassified Streptomyces]KJY42439.1 hypothetical protein VR46_23575 [Streptomyces sp. NRRL S-444]KOY54778.1 hypothetical protein ADK59_27025 [Streptomyces sp. XY332]THA40211.1 hypothetical protein E6W17_08025 [Streptomyces sp. A1547]
MTSTEFIEYRLEHLRDRLAREEISELGVRVEARGAGALVRGSVNSADCRAAVLRIAGEELAGVLWHEDVTVSCPGPPDHSEELP